MLDERGRVLGGLQRKVGPFRLAVALAGAHRGVHAIQPAKGVGLLAGQLGEHERDAVAKDVRGAAHAHRDHRLQRSRLLAVIGQVGAHPSGHGREHHVVNRGAVGALDRPQIVQGPLGPS